MIDWLVHDVESRFVLMLNQDLLIPRFLSLFGLIVPWYLFGLVRLYVDSGH